MSNDWLPTRREEQLSMARMWFEFFTNGNFPKWGITAPEAAGLGFIVQKSDSHLFSILLFVSVRGKFFSLPPAPSAL